MAGASGSVQNEAESDGSGTSGNAKPSIFNAEIGKPIAGRSEGVSKPSEAFKAKLGEAARPEPQPGTFAGGEPDEHAPYGYFPDGRPRKRKPKGTGTKTTRTKTEDLKGLEGLLLSLHTMASIGFSAPELALSESEAKEIARAINTVQNEFDITVDPKTTALLNLAGVLGMAYGPRLYVLSGRVKKKAASAPAPAPAPVASAKAPGKKTDATRGAVVPSQLGMGGG